jgi:hypothetical protein
MKNRLPSRLTSSAMWDAEPGEGVDFSLIQWMGNSDGQSGSPCFNIHGHQLAIETDEIQFTPVASPAGAVSGVLPYRIHTRNLFDFRRYPEFPGLISPAPPFRRPENPSPTFEDGLNSQLMLDVARKSVKTRCCVDL